MRPWVVFGVWMDGESRVEWGHMVEKAGSGERWRVRSGRVELRQDVRVAMSGRPLAMKREG